MYFIIFFYNTYVASVDQNLLYIFFESLRKKNTILKKNPTLCHIRIHKAISELSVPTWQHRRRPPFYRYSVSVLLHGRSVLYNTVINRRVSFHGPCYIFTNSLT